jgi:branched-chain amino acid transport system permease protein
MAEPSRHDSAAAGAMPPPSASRKAGASPGLPRPARHHALPDIILAAALLAAPFVLPHLGFVPNTMSRILVMGLFGIGFDLLFGYTGLLSFGQSAFFGTGGFVAAYLLTRMGMSSVMLALLIGMVAAAVTGYLVGLIALRRTGIYFAMITVAIAEVFFFVENSPLSDFTGGENGLPGVPSPTFYFGFTTIPIGSGWTMYGFLAVCYFLGIVVARRIVHSPVGRILVAIRDNPLRAAAVGHNVHGYKLLVFVVAAAYAGIAGGLLGVMQGYMPPDAFTFDTSGQLVMQTVIGGLGTLYGPLVGAAVWLYLRDFLQDTAGLGAAWKLALGVIFVLLVCFLRRGIIGGLRDLYDLTFSRRALAPEPDEAAPAPGITAEQEQRLAEAEVAREPAPPPMPPRHRAHDGYQGPILQATGLTKRYGGLVANSDIDFTVQHGELRGVIGPNGAGKSTFFKMLTCEIVPTSGKIVFEGVDITGKTVTEACQLGLTKSYQVNQLFSRLTVRENLTIAVLAELRGQFRFDMLRRTSTIPGLDEQVTHTLEMVNLTARADVPVSALAYGEKRRLEIGLALANSPSLLLLDEPLAGMSPRERVETVKLLKSIAKGRTMIVIDHDMDALFELVERITVLQEGRVLVEGTPQEIKNNPTVQEAYLGGVLE